MTPSPALLLTPGPVTLSDRVRRAMASVDLCHREPEFAELTRELLERLPQVYDSTADDFDAVVLSGSGTLAVEAMLASLAPSSSRSLVASNGVYGERVVAMLAAHGKPHEVVESSWLDPIDVAAVEARIQADASISHVLAIHHETTTGRLNDVGALGDICRRHGRALLLDAVSSFGAETIHGDDWALEALAATANKCLHGAPGLCFVLARRERLATGADLPGSVYLDLSRYWQVQQQEGFSPFTQAVPAALALREALRELEESGGVAARRERYHHIGETIRTTLADLGVSPLIEPDMSSACLRSFELPGDVTYDELHDELRRCGFVIYAGQGKLAARIFRIAHMGAIDNDALGRLAEALRDILGS